MVTTFIFFQQGCFCSFSNFVLLIIDSVLCNKGCINGLIFQTISRKDWTLGTYVVVFLWWGVASALKVCCLPSELSIATWVGRPLGIFLGQNWKSSDCHKRNTLFFYEQSQNDTDVVLVSLLLTLNRFHNLFWCLYCWLWTGKYPKEVICSTEFSTLTVKTPYPVTWGNVLMLAGQLILL